MNLHILYSLIRRFEGLKLKPYFCPAGVLTIGYGHTGKDVIASKNITIEEAEALLRKDVDYYVGAAIQASPILLDNTNRLCAIADFCFNLGIARYKASTLKRCVDKGDWEHAKEQLQKWVWGGGKKLPGLILRRQAEAALL